MCERLALVPPVLDANERGFLDKELPGVQALTLDFAECDYVSSAGLRVLLATFKRMRSANGSMNFVNVGKGFSDVFQLTDLARIFGLQ